MTLPRRLALALPFAVMFVPGCSRDGKPGPLAPQFATIPRSQKEFAADPLSGADQPGALYRTARTEQQLPEGPGGATDTTVLSKTVRENVRPPGQGPDDMQPSGVAPTTMATSGPATRGYSTGQFLTIGGVVADVNSTPIYANKVLEVIEPALAARAKDLDATQFRNAATYEINRQIIAECKSQLEYAAAERNLDAKDKQIADYLTEQWKQKEITANEGLERAKKAAKERGKDFDELLQEQYRLNMSLVYRQKKLMPRIQVNAADMRAYYDANRNNEFTDRGQAQFRIILLNVRKHDGRENTLRLAEELRNRITKAGEKFEAIARSVNDDPRLLKSGGEVGKIDEGAFRIGPVDKAVWATPVGEVTPIVDTGDSLYLALVEEKKPGSVLQFEDEGVQARITEKLYAIQFREAREKDLNQLLSDAVIRQDKNMINIAVEMAMQNYPRWAGK